MDDLQEPTAASRSLNLNSRGDSDARPRPTQMTSQPTRGPLLGDWLKSAAAAHPFDPLERLRSGKTPPLLWGASEDWPADAPWLAVIPAKGGGPKSKAANQAVIAAAQRLAADSNVAELEAALQLTALAYAVPLVGKLADEAAAESILPLLLAQVEAAGDTARHSPVTRLLREVELPLVMARYAPDLRTANTLRKAALAAEARIATLTLDTLGLPNQGRWRLLRPVVAALVRCHELQRTSELQFSDAARDRLARLTRNVLRQTRPDGGSILSTQAGSSADREFLAAAMLQSESARPIAELALGKPSKRPSEVKLPKGTTAAPLYSASSSLAMLRTRWAAPAVQVTCDFATPQTWLDVTSGNHSLIHGTWNVQLKVSGTALAPLGPWTEVCWYSDADCDYLEIEQKLSGNYLLQRHLLLIRRDQCLLLADSVLDETKQAPVEFLASSSQAPQLEYSTRLPLSPGITFAPQADTREGQLLHKKQRLAHVLPIALPEWRKQPVTGELAVTENALQHTLRTTGRNLFAPLWIDLHPGRQKSPLTWRQLTIGESLAVQPREVAVGYRVQVHSMQWLLYRSLAWRGNRTVLGKNFATDFACCRFLPNGETEEILEVQ